ncbi:hypothetical protein BDD43_3431 [Mucilaginibacter gracilis]|uniref:Uncharacterized protein n=1 Tax=Mucilaginibacter gracilis TaxID=423350 RepID=A0A495J4B9_9SPHI|nr:hypothetical protein [Mucilaginibacter gracilis]RKR83228.1 hypothetical protein BDD43_3431 [Mucilaginibacter gracilis]
MSILKKTRIAEICKELNGLETQIEALYDVNPLDEDSTMALLTAMKHIVSATAILTAINK